MKEKSMANLKKPEKFECYMSREIFHYGYPDVKSQEFREGVYRKENGKWSFEIRTDMNPIIVFKVEELKTSLYVMFIKEVGNRNSYSVKIYGSKWNGSSWDIEFDKNICDKEEFDKLFPFVQGMIAKYSKDFDEVRRMYYDKKKEVV